MNSCLPDEPTVQRLIAEINACTPRPHHASLLAVTARLIPDCSCRFALTRGGWYHPGGLISAAGERLADDLETWLTHTLAACDDDLGAWHERHGDAALIVTRHTGKTHFFVAPYGPGPAEYLQMEVEEIQEVLDRHLWTSPMPPEELQDLLDPPAPEQVAAQPVAAPRYRFRRLTDLNQVAAHLDAGRQGMPAPLRFMREWAASHVGAHPGAHFCAHWIVSLREHRDRYGNPTISATPVSLHARPLKSFQWNPDLRGLEAAAQLQAFDRAAGYGGAWYFHLVAGGITPRAIAFALQHDLDAGYRYLGDTQTALLQGWLNTPYSV